MTPENCSTCKWSLQVGVHKEGDIVLAECRRFPPTATLVPGPGGQPSKITFFPAVNETMSCGEWHIAIITN